MTRTRYWSPRTTSETPRGRSTAYVAANSPGSRWSSATGGSSGTDTAPSSTGQHPDSTYPIRSPAISPTWPAAWTTTPSTSSDAATCRSTAPYPNNASSKPEPAPPMSRRQRSLDLAGVSKLATRFRKLSRGDERNTFEKQYVNLRVSDDGAVWHLSGRLTATDGQVVRKALDRRADQIPPLTSDSDLELTPAQKQAIGLTTMAQDDLDQHLRTGRSRRTRTGHPAHPRPDPRERIRQHPRRRTLRRPPRRTAGRRDGRMRRTHRTHHHHRRPSHRNRASTTPGPQTAPPSRARQGPPMRHRLLPERLPAPNPPHHPQTRRRSRHGREPRHPLLVPPSHRHPPAWTPHRPPHATTAAAGSYRPEPGPTTGTRPTSNTSAPTNNNNAPTKPSSTNTTPNNPTPAASNHTRPEQDRH